VKVARVLVACLLLVGVLSLAAAASEQKVMQVRIYPADKSQVEEILSQQLDVAYVQAGEYIDIITDQEELGRLLSKGFDANIVHSDLVAFYQSRLEQGKDMGGYHTYSEVMVALDSMHTRYPSITTAKMDIGHSLEDSVIWAIKISDNPTVDEDEPEVFFNSLIHAREPAGMEVLLYFMWYLLDNYGTDPVATHLVNDRELWFVPVVNPEGYCYNEYQHPGGGGMWRANRRDCGPDYGVDLNRNWGYMWGYDDQGSSPYCGDETYRGTGPFSEPTTQVIRDFINDRDFVMCLDNHTYGMWLIYPWCYDRLYTPDHNLFVAITDSMAAFNGHTPGTAWETVNYPVNGGSVDWEYGEAGIIAVSPEIGTQDDGFWPPPSRILPLCQLELPANLLYAELADNPRRILPPNAPTLAAIDSVPADYTVRWSHQDTLNPAAVFELVEMTGFSRSTYDVEGDYSNWELGGFTVSTTRSHSATHSFYSGRANNLNNKVTCASSINVQPNDSLRIWCWYNIEEDWDYAYVEVSTDGGTSFLPLAGNITTTYNPYGQNQGNGITGSSGGSWVEGKFSLSSYVGQQVYLRLHYVTDGWTTYEGFYADDIYPFESYESMVTLSDAIPDTFYQITGQEQGTYDYKVKAKDQQNQWGAWSNVETAVVSAEQQFTRGDANGDGTITLSDAVFLINYLYKDGPVPDPPAAGDANSDGQTELGDVVYVLNYLYKGGPPPQK